MTAPRVVRFYLYPDLLLRAHTGRDGLIRSMQSVLHRQGFQTHLHDDSAAELAAAADRPGYGVFRMIDPPNPYGVTFRKTYLDPFFRIESHGRRWDWPVAQTRFDPSNVNPAKAARFMGNWRKKLFGTEVPTHEGFTLVPLQGRLLEKRPFQTCSPLAMLESVLAHAPGPLIATLHPRETYTTAEITALEALTRAHPQLSLRKGGSDVLLPRCDNVVTQNSSVALLGYFLAKPAALFASVDFHHIAARADTLGGPEAIRALPDLKPDFAAYLWWFFRDHAIDTSRPDAETRITQSLRRAGWPLD